MSHAPRSTSLQRESATGELMLKWLFGRRHKSDGEEAPPCPDPDEVCHEAQHRRELDEQRRDLQRLQDELRLVTRRHTPRTENR